MMRFVAVIISALVLLGLVGAGWYYRPWSDYAPARIRALDDPAQYPQTYQRMDEFLPHTFIAADAPSPFPHALRPLDIQYEWQGETKTLDQYLEEAQVTGLTVLHRGEVVAQIYGHDAGAQSRFTSWSVGKSFVATLIGKALHEGRIASLDDTVEQYAPEYAGTDYGATSLRHLLMMSSGMDFNEEYSADAPSDVRPLFFNAFILRRNPDEMIARIERDRTPGEDFHYISPNSHVLSAVVRNVYEGRLAEIMERELWTPLGMKNEASWLQHKPALKASPSAIAVCRPAARTMRAWASSIFRMASGTVSACCLKVGWTWSRHRRPRLMSPAPAATPIGAMACTSGSRRIMIGNSTPPACSASISGWIASAISSSPRMRAIRTGPIAMSR